MTTACIVQARLRSTRLPGKVLLPLPTGRTVLEEVLYRCRRIDGVDVVVAAIADDGGSDLLVPYAEKARRISFSSRELPANPTIGDIHRKFDSFAPIEIVRGPEHDVLARYLKAAEAVRADVILRVTSDCPLIEPEECAKVLRLRESANVEYAANNLFARDFPLGWDCEAFTIGALRRANEVGTDATDLAANREHVTYWLRNSKCVTRAAHKGMMENRGHVRWTLDTIEDYIVICNEFERRIAQREAA